MSTVAVAPGFTRARVAKVLGIAIVFGLLSLRARCHKHDRIWAVQ